MELEVYKGRKGHYWRAKSTNGKVLCVSGRYATRSNAKRAARRFLYDSQGCCPIVVQNE